MTKFSGSEWTKSMIEDIWTEVEISAAKFGLDYIPPQIEIVQDDVFINNYIYAGLPVYYTHWSFGKQFTKLKNQYEGGNLNLALETILNTDPAICYISENNTLAEQVLVIAHAAVGHSNFFKNNYMFKDNTDAKMILPVMKSLNEYLKELEHHIPYPVIELALDLCHSLELLSFDQYERKPPKSLKEVRDHYVQLQSHNSELHTQHKSTKGVKFPSVISLMQNYETHQSMDLPEYNLLWFIEQNLKPYYAEHLIPVFRTFRYISQYFYPQRYTKMMNEGWATFVQGVILDDLYDRDIIDDGIMVENCRCASMVTYQQHGFMKTAHLHKLGYKPVPMNPYKLGVNIFKDIDKKCNRDWDVLKDACYNYRDDSFIHQFLSPAVVSDMQLATLYDLHSANHYVVDEVATDEDFPQVKQTLANQYNISYYIPSLYIDTFNLDTREALVKHKPINGVKIEKNSDLLRITSAMKEFTGIDFKLEI